MPVIDTVASLESGMLSVDQVARTYLSMTMRLVGAETARETADV